MLKKKSEILGRACSNGKTFSELDRKHEVFSDVKPFHLVLDYSLNHKA